MIGRRPAGWRAAAIVLIISAACGCANLPGVNENICGNGVIEAPEDCDGFAPDGLSVCRPRGAAGECHLDCGRRADGTRPPCPDEWGCDVQGVCRQPTGQFERAAESNIGGAWSLLSGDFDGDGRDDVVSLELPDARGRTRLRTLYFDESGGVADMRSFPKLLAMPVVNDLSGDGRSDIIFSNFTIGLLLGSADRSLVPETFGSYRFQDVDVRFSTIYHDPVQDISAVVSLTTIDGVPGLYVPDVNGILRVLGDLPGGLEAQAGDPVSGDVIEDPAVSPCREMILAVRGATSFSVVDTCTSAPGTGQVVWRTRFEEMTVALDPPAAIDGSPQLADVNVDGHLDVLVDAGGRPYVAYGDGRSLAVATPYRLALANPMFVSPDIPMPLAAGDFTGDGIVDFVFPDQVLVSSRSSTGALPTYRTDQANDGAPWTVARIADVNGNGLPDVVAASSLRLGIDFFNGSGSEHVLAFNVPTTQPVLFLTTGDLDGDLIDDVGFVQKAASEQERDAVMVAFGGFVGPPLAPVTVARVDHAVQLGVIDQVGIGNLFVVYRENLSGHDNGVLAVLAGGGDRLPFAPLQLVNVSADSSVFVSSALGVAVGRFGGAGPADVLVLTTDGNLSKHDFHFWMLPSLAGSFSAALPLGGELDARLQPATVEGFHLDVSLVGTAADVDGDGRDEAFWAMPADGGTRCGVAIVGTSVGASAGNASAPSALIMRDTIVLDQPCPGARILAVDADGDGRSDIAMLTGGPGLPGRRLVVLWNDGRGGFAASDLVILNGPDESPEQFAVLAATRERPLTFAYVTDDAIRLVSATETARQFGPPRALASVQHGSGIVAADVNGDGVTDLAVAAAGNISLFMGGLKTQ